MEKPNKKTSCLHCGALNDCDSDDFHTDCVVCGHRVNIDSCNEYNDNFWNNDGI